jgi:hypothetical protein
MIYRATAAAPVVVAVISWAERFKREKTLGITLFLWSFKQ